MTIRAGLLIALGVAAIFLIVMWARGARRTGGFALPGPLLLFIGFITNFFDTLGIGSFAPTTSMFKFWHGADARRRRHPFFAD
jgi:hypothetical protein